MKALIANQDLVTELLTMPECVDVMADTLTMLAGGEALLPLRTMMYLPNVDNLMSLMPSYLGGIQSVGVKVTAAFPSNYGTEYDTHQGIVVLFDTEQGLLRAIVDGTAVTAIRTAAVSGVATRLLARPTPATWRSLGPVPRRAPTWQRCFACATFAGYGSLVCRWRALSSLPSASRNGMASGWR